MDDGISGKADKKRAHVVPYPADLHIPDLENIFLRSIILAKKKTASKGSKSADTSEKESAAAVDTSLTVAKKATKKKTSKKTAKKTTKKVAQKTTKKTTKKVSKKTSKKKTTKKKTTKKTSKKAGSQPAEEAVTAVEITATEEITPKVTEEVTPKVAEEVTPKPAKKTGRKTGKTKIDTSKTAISAQTPPKEEEPKAPIEKPLSELTIEERIARKEAAKSLGTREPAPAAKPKDSGTTTDKRKSVKAAATSAQTSPRVNTDKAPLLKGEKISGGLLALEQQAAKKNSPQQNHAPEKPAAEPEVKIQTTAPKPEKELNALQPTILEAETDAEDEDKKLSRSARRRRNKRKKKEQEKFTDDSGNSSSESADSQTSGTSAQNLAPITATAILAEKQKEQDTQNRKNTGRNMLMNVVDHGEIRVAIAGKKGLEEIYIEKSGGEFVHGNIFKGVVENVEPNLQAAFINIGAEKNGFLHVRDVIYPFGGYEDIFGKSNRQKPSSKRPPINQMLHKGQEVLVQITREQVATKGPSLTTYISLPGRYLVLMPAVKKRGVSKKINDRGERDELRKALDQLDPPNDMGYIIRTAGMGKGKDELQRDLDYLTMLWDAITTHAKNVKGPMPIYQESDLVIRAIRDYFTDNIDIMYIDSEDEFKRAQEFLKLTMPEDLKRAKFYGDSEPLFSHYDVEDEISGLFSKSVRLKSGGELIIEQTEAMVTIDVNTGKFVKGKSSQDMVLKINREAASEIAKQLRLRDMGGLVMIDFIDMDSEEDRRNVENIFRNAMKADRAKTTILPISALGVMEMTRQRMRQSLNLSHFDCCKHCGGTGVIKNIATIETEFIRALRSELKDGKSCKIKMNPETALEISNKSRLALSSLEKEYNCSINVCSDHSLRPDKFVIGK